MIEILRSFRPRAGTAILAGSLLISACSKDQSNQIPSPDTKAVASDTANNLKITTDYFPNGIRILRYLQNDGGIFIEMIDSCDGSDFIEQIEFLEYGYQPAGNSTSRRENFPACADDGKLTPEDFKLPG